MHHLHIFTYVISFSCHNHHELFSFPLDRCGHQGSKEITNFPVRKRQGWDWRTPLTSKSILFANMPNS